MNTTNWKRIQTGIKQIRATLHQGQVKEAIDLLDTLDVEVQPTRRNQSQIDSEILALDASLMHFNGLEQAYEHCNLLYNRQFFLHEPDGDFKIALVAYLHKKWPTRNNLWMNLYKREIEYLYLL